MVLAAWAVGGWARASDDPPKEMPPVVVTKATEMLKKATVQKRKQLDALMRDEIDTTVKDTGLNAEGAAKLEAAATKAKDAAQEDFAVQCLQALRKIYAKDGASGLSWISRPNAPDIAAGPTGPMGDGGHYTEPQDQPVWTEAVAAVLSPAQIAAREKARTARKETADRLIGGFLDQQADRYRPQMETGITAQSGEISGALDLPKEREDQLTALAKAATAASMEAWRAAATKSLMGQSESQRAQALKNKNYFFRFSDKDAPEKQPVWTEGLAKLLTDADRARLQAVRDSKKTRRVHALARLGVALLDERIAFTSAQRTRLEPILEPLVQAQPDFFPTAGSSNYYAFQPANFFKAIAKAKDEDLHPAILDEIQWPRWQALARDKNAGNLGNEDDDSTSARAKLTEVNQESSAGEPEDMEQVVSDYLQNRAAAHYRQVETVMVLQVEDATRVAGLEAPHVLRLQTAARGASDAALVTWMPNVEQNTRSELQGATPENIRQKLANGSRYSYERSDAQKDALWTATVNAELTAPQQAAWKVESDARKQYNADATTAFLLAEFDRKFSLLPEQWDKLAPAVAKALREYQPDIQGMFSYNNVPWYMTSYYMFLPLHALPEGEFKAVLNKGQWDRWSGSREFGYTANYWENIRRSHTQRTEQKEP